MHGKCLYIYPFRIHYRLNHSEEALDEALDGTFDPSSPIMHVGRSLVLFPDHTAKPTGY